MITTDINGKIAHAAHAENMKNNLKECNGWTDADLDNINWRALGEAKHQQPQQ